MKTPHEQRVEEVEKKLNAVLNKAVLFNDQVITIIGFKIFTTAVTIVTNEKSFTVELHLIEQFLEKLSGEIPTTYTPINTKDYIDWDEPVKNKFPEIAPEQLKNNDKMENKTIAENQPLQENNSLVTTSNLPDKNNIGILNYNPTQDNVQIKEALMGMLGKVTANPSAIPQAKAVCEIANTMINMQKNEIQMIQLVNRSKK